jgi:hypothetical protein
MTLIVKQFEDCKKFETIAWWFHYWYIGYLYRIVYVISMEGTAIVVYKWDCMITGITWLQELYIAYLCYRQIWNHSSNTFLVLLWFFPFLYDTCSCATILCSMKGAMYGWQLCYVAGVMCGFLRVHRWHLPCWEILHGGRTFHVGLWWGVHTNKLCWFYDDCTLIMFMILLV